MLTENQKIMREIHNEQQDLESSVEGITLLKYLSKLNYLDEPTRKLLWRCAHLKQTFFGAGFLEEHQDKNQELNNEDEDEVNELQNLLIKSLLMATLEYNEKGLNSNPVLLLAKILSNELVLHGEKFITEEIAITLLYGLIECETLASWLLVCKLDN